MKSRRSRLSAWWPHFDAGKTVSNGVGAPSRAPIAVVPTADRIRSGVDEGARRARRLLKCRARGLRPR
jgi:hypothetical protein